MCGIISALEYEEKVGQEGANDKATKGALNYVVNG